MPREHSGSGLGGLMGIASAAPLLLIACEAPLPCAHAEIGVADPAVTRFVALGDTGTGEPNQYAVAEALATACSTLGCDFILLLGDNFYPAGVPSPHAEAWSERVDMPYGALGIPVYAVLGNHDYGDAGYDITRAHAQVLRSGMSETWRMPSTCYGLSAGPAFLVALDTQQIMMDYRDAVFRHGAFVDDALDATRAPWVIAVGHHPLLSNGPHGNAGSYNGMTWPPQVSGKYVREVFDRHLCHRADLYISGHDHSRQVIAGPSACGLLQVVSGAGAKTTELIGQEPSLFQQATLGFTHFELSETTLRLRMIDVQGTTDYALTITAGK